ncbi:hypothetical protein DL768_011208 [Monosporascus sp. mg162]|nr:hypothetical protein DL768_011208 [Monosporascus sp. mg162]
MAIAAKKDLEARQYDVETAFLNALREGHAPVTCALPDGFKKSGVCAEIERALYGLRDSPLLWYREFSTTLQRLGLTPSPEEPCLFYDEQRTVILMFFVDDLLLFYHREHQSKADQLIYRLKGAYELKDQGEVSWFLGIRVIRDRSKRQIILAHDSYIEKIATRFGLANDAYVPPTPLGTEELVSNSGIASKEQIKGYQERIGSILYTAVMIRPDVAFAASLLSKFLTNPSAKHIKAANRVIRYLYHTRFLAIVYGGVSEEAQVLLIAGDASFADDPETRRSSQGYIMTLFGGAIVWKAARQATVTTSTTKAELLALEHTAKEAMALKRLFHDLRLELGQTWDIFCDNQQTIRLVVGENERITTRLRHVDVQNMWLRQEQSRGSFNVTYLPTAKMPADGLTKALPRQQFEHFRSLLNLQDLRQETTTAVAAAAAGADQGSAQQGPAPAHERRQGHRQERPAAPAAAAAAAAPPVPPLLLPLAPGAHEPSPEGGPPPMITVSTFSRAQERGGKQNIRGEGHRFRAPPRGARQQDGRWQG